MSRNYNMKKNLSNTMGLKKRRRRNQQKPNEKKRLQNFNFSNNIVNKVEPNSLSSKNSRCSSKSNELLAKRTNMDNANSFPSSNFKFVIIDGNNIGMAHGITNFSAFGLQLAVNFFIKRGHKDIKVLVPRYRRFESQEYGIFDELESKGYLCFTPSRYLNGKLIVPYDDRFILEAAEYFNAIIVSNDNFCDIKEEKPEWKRLVENNLLQFMFVGDLFLVASDPIGKNGPTLEQFLSRDNECKILNEF